ncbi:MAG: cation transporter [Firmicutes bacterium]|nr:cation transporter [Bacillota bacterium]
MNDPIKKENEKLSRDDFERTTVRVSSVSIIGNAVLSALKVLAGIFASSGAMISDGIHSLSDVFSSIIVIIGVKISSKDSDKSHPYGHERFECVAALVLAMVLVITSLFIARGAFEQISSGEELKVPGVLALAAAVISIVCKELMFRYTRFYAKVFDSTALMADAWHHRSDALSSVGALVGIAGARLGYPVLDKAASLLICLFIFKAAFDIFSDAVSKMVDSSCSEEKEAEIVKCAEAQEGVMGVDLILTRVFGNKIYVDIEIGADKNKTLAEGHETAEKVHDAIEREFPEVKHVMVHVNPK